MINISDVTIAHLRYSLFRNCIHRGHENNTAAKKNEFILQPIGIWIVLSISTINLCYAQLLRDMQLFIIFIIMN